MSITPSSKCDACGGAVRPGVSFCPRCGKKQALPAADHGVNNNPGKPRWLIVIAACAVALFVYLFIDHLPGGDHPVIAGQPVVSDAPPAAGEHADQVSVAARVDGGDLTIPLSAVREKRIVEFEYSDGTVSVPLLAFITGEGKLVTAYRMCEPCNSKKFSIDGDRMSCGNCETQWSLNTLEGLQGSCQKYPPEPFPSRIEDDRVIISVAQIRKWQIRL
ncbi:MAG TPA: Fe-S-containing protein [Bacteroidota bacterium]|nr:Fe-S-containing protein [Bacteroidota bacterium]